MNLTAWKGEKISAQLVVWTPKALNDLTFMVSDLTSGSATISKENIRTGFVRYVITDELNKDGLGACGFHCDSSCVFPGFSALRDVYADPSPLERTDL